MEISKGTIINIPTLRFSPSYERLEYDAEVPPNLINSKVGVATNETAGNDLAILLGAKVFDFPKPSSLIAELIDQVTESNDIVLDFFAGSGSTGHAVLNLNQQNGRVLNFIAIQIPEATDEKSEAYKANYKKI